MRMIRVSDMVELLPAEEAAFTSPVPRPVYGAQGGPSPRRRDTKQSAVRLRPARKLNRDVLAKARSLN